LQAAEIHSLAGEVPAEVRRSDRAVGRKGAPAVVHSHEQKVARDRTREAGHALAEDILILVAAGAVAGARLASCGHAPEDVAPAAAERLVVEGQCGDVEAAGMLAGVGGPSVEVVDRRQEDDDDDEEAGAEA